MDSLIVSINAILPTCLLICLGYFIKEKAWISENSVKEMNTLVFKLFLPILLMKNMLDTDLSQAFQPKLIIYCILMLVVIVIGSMLIVPSISTNKNKQGAIVQALFRSNFVLLGLPIVASVFPNTDIGVTSIVVAFLVPCFNVLAVFVLQYYSKTQVNLKNLLIGIITNPMIIGTLAGLVILILQIQLPTPIMGVIKSIASASTPIAIIILGASFKIKSVKDNASELIKIVVIRLIIVPLIAIGGAVMLGYHGVELVTMVVLFGGPVAVSSFAMAVSMGQDGELASQAVLVTTVSCVLSLFAWIFILNNMGLIL